MSFIYQFINEQNEIIYIGRTENKINTRIAQHFIQNGHLAKEAYSETKLIKVAKTPTVNDLRIYEIYYISLLKPKYNQQHKNGGTVFFELPSLEFSIHEIIKYHNPLVSEITQEYISKFHKDVKWRMEKIGAYASGLEDHFRVDEKYTEGYVLTKEDKKSMKKNHKDALDFFRGVLYEMDELLKKVERWKC